jgi:hypothetical protein
LLNVAVDDGELEMIQLLISFGADPHARSNATKLFVPRDLERLSVAPGEIARL